MTFFLANDLVIANGLNRLRHPWRFVFNIGGPRWDGVDRPWSVPVQGTFSRSTSGIAKPCATEQIAEPHNFVVETLAAGGFPAMGLLAVLAIVAAFVIWGRGSLKPQETVGPSVESSASTPGQESSSAARWVWLGALVALAMVWLLGWISRQPPDLDASLYVFPVLITIAWLLGASLPKITGQELDTLIGIAIAAIGIHLLISGGWTVPGVAIVIWIFAGMLTRYDHHGDKQVTGVGWSWPACRCCDWFLPGLLSLDLLAEAGAATTHLDGTSRRCAESGTASEGAPNARSGRPGGSLVAGGGPLAG